MQPRAEAQVGERAAQLQALRAHAGEVSCADACGARLVTGGGRALRAWHWARGAGWQAGAHAAPAHRYGVTAARWSPRGALVASGGVDGALRVWAVGRRAGALRARRVLAAPGAGAVRALCWGGEGALLGAHDDGAVCVWRPDTGALRARLAAHEEAVHALAAPAGALLLTCCSTGVLKVFDLQEVCARAAAGLGAPAPLVWADGAHAEGALCADAARGGRAAATGGHDARVRVWRRARAERCLRAAETLEGHGAGVTALRWGARGVLASASLDRTARLWRRGACLCVLRAHARYLTCLALAPDLRYLITGSNDRTVRMWSLGDLTLDDDLEPPCDPAAHFALGDLEGIERPVDEDDLLEPTVNGGVSTSDGEGEEGEERESGGARCLWRSRALHSGAINGIAAHGDLLATASSDGTVRTLRWNATMEQLEPQRRVWGAEGEGEEAGEGQGGEDGGERGYPVLAADLGAGGALLLCGGLDGAAQLLDVQSGAALRTLSPRGAEGGTGVRGARLSPHRPPLILLATDTGAAPLWSLADADPEPLHVFAGHEAAALCCAWAAAAGGRAAALCATGGEAGELRLHAAPPHARTLCHVTDAHDLGVQSCDFAPSSAAVGLREEDQLLLATAGSDSFVKLWLVDLDQEWGAESAARVRLLHSVAAHGGGATCVRWGALYGAGGGTCMLASGGADRWARAWRAGREGVRAAGAVPTRGAVAVTLLGSDLLVLGTMTGELAVWRLPPGEGEGERPAEEGEGEDEGPDPRWWGEAGVVRWLREYVTRVPGAAVAVESAGAARLEAAARAQHLTGAQLLDAPLGELLAALGEDVESEAERSEDVERVAEAPENAGGLGGAQDSLWARLREELHWLRRDAPRDGLEWVAPHGLLCAASHGLLRAPVRAADGFTYERAALHEHRQAADDVVSPMTGRRMRNARVSPNYKLMAELRAFLREHEGEGEGEGDDDE